MLLTSRQSTLLSFSVVIVLYVAFLVAERPDWALLSDATEGMLKLALWVVPCLLLIRVTRRVGYGGVFAELGLQGSIARGYAFGMVATLPMLVVLTGPSPRGGNLTATIGGVILGPIAEEILFRGYFFRQLYLRGGWTVRRAIVASALAFGLAHAGNVPWDGPSSLVATVGEIGTTAAGGLLFAWLVFRWDSLWPAIGLHAFLNLWWELSGGEDWFGQTHGGAASGTQLANAARLASVGLAIYLTFIRTRSLRKLDSSTVR